MLGLARRQRVSALGRQESGRRFRELADRTSDVVLICDLAGVIGYASPAVAGYGYPPESLMGRHLGDFLHPEDRIGGARVVRAAVSGPEQRAGRYPCRVRAADGTWRHVQATVSRQANPPGPDQLLITARDLSDQVALRRQVAHLTFHDGLTGLPNRAYIEDRARDALGAIGQRAATDPAAGSPGGGPWPEGTSPPAPGGGPGETGPGGPGQGGAGVILLDLDGFTALNDSAGRSAGDLILTQAARRLRAVVPAPHTVARWGRDAFAVLIEGGASASEIIDIAERVAASISAEPFRVGDRELAMHASVGVAVADGSPPGFLWRSADLAMLRARQAGGGRVEVPAAASRQDPTGRVELARDLQRAISAWAAGRSRPSGPAGAGGRPRPAAAAGTGEQLPPAALAGAADEEQVPQPTGPGVLSLAFQPVMDVGAGRIVRADVLVRWHRAGQEVPTPELLSLAEASGLSVPLGEVVLREACAQAGEWHRAGLAVAACVPVPGAQAVAPRFAESVAEALAGSGLPAGSLTLEVAERDLIGGGEVPPGLADARRAGARIAIAGFGTDYASLSCLRRQPIDAVKIAPSLVAGLGGDPALAKLVEAIVRVGRERGIGVIAAGVDQPAHLGWLRAMRCLLAQGSAIAPAMAAADLMAAVRAGPDAPAVSAGDGPPPADRAGNGTPVPASLPGAESSHGAASRGTASPVGGSPDCPGSGEPPAPGMSAEAEAAVNVSDTETKLLPG
ncbi:MAG: EAL domain-containing protein [Nocardiopsaceae bacterium]|nr:EAL domain-containing protein [Nocardiopsaceae bacterium]